ncbi:MAG: C-GCAxxG-C-C family protein [Rikenellaceae bacterium]
MEQNSKKIEAVNLFREGYNCAQSVVVAFHNECGMSKEMAESIAAPFGAGIGRQREVCGAVSGMCLVLGATSHFDSNEKREGRATIYATTQELCAEFKAAHGSIVCREILKGGASTYPMPEERTVEYYAKRPCERCVEDAAGLIANFLEQNKRSQNI